VKQKSQTKIISYKKELTLNKIPQASGAVAEYCYESPWQWLQLHHLILTVNR
jgi:hypothetical protein